MPQGIHNHPSIFMHASRRTNKSNSVRVVSVIAIQVHFVERPRASGARVGRESSVLATIAERRLEGEPLSQGIERLPAPLEVRDQAVDAGKDLETLAAARYSRLAIVMR
jgi:hypothetical protein